MIRICGKCSHVTGQRHCVYCGYGTAGANEKMRPGAAPKDQETRQSRRAALRAKHWERFQLGSTPKAGELSRRERRKMARAYAAGEWGKRPEANVRQAARA